MAEEFFPPTYMAEKFATTLLIKMEVLSLRKVLRRYSEETLLFPTAPALRELLSGITRAMIMFLSRTCLILLIGEITRLREIFPRKRARCLNLCLIPV